MAFRRLTATLAALVIFGACDSTPRYDYGVQKPEDIKFNDSAQTNADVAGSIANLAFVGTGGEAVSVSDYAGKKNVLVVVTRGFTQPICPFCQTQTSRLVSNYAKFQDLGTEVLLVYPGNKGQVEQFLQTVNTVDKGQIENVPFKICLDDGLDAVHFFGIEANRALPSTYIFDKQGQTRFAYVGQTDSDRPSIDAIIAQLQLLKE